MDDRSKEPAPWQVKTYLMDEYHSQDLAEAASGLTATEIADGETAREKTSENYNVNDDLYRMILAALAADQPCALTLRTEAAAVRGGGGGGGPAAAAAGG